MHIIVSRYCVYGVCRGTMTFSNKKLNGSVIRLMELHQLQYFVAVAEMGSFTRAAERCLVAQPSLSQQIIKLEKELKHLLFERLGKTVKLTQAGHDLYERATSILSSVEDAKRSVQEDQDGRGRLVVGAIPTVAPYLLPGIAERFLRRCPQAELEITEDVTQQIVRSCLQGQVDIGILALPIQDPHLQVEPLFEEELLLAIPAKHRLASKRRITMRMIRDEPFVLLHEAHCLGEQIISLCRQSSFQPAPVCRSSQLLTVQQMVGLGHGISLIPAMAMKSDKGKRIHYRSLAGKTPMRTVAMIWCKKRYQSPIMQAFIGTLRESSVG